MARRWLSSGTWSLDPGHPEACLHSLQSPLPDLARYEHGFNTLQGSDTQGIDQLLDQYVVWGLAILPSSRSVSCSLFGAGDPVGKNSATGGYRNVIKNGLSSILTSMEAGESEEEVHSTPSIAGRHCLTRVCEQKSCVIFQHNTLVHVDAKAWRYNFGSSEIKQSVESCFGCTFMPSLLRLEQSTAY